MAIQTTRWSPDTCNCVHEYTWDDSVPADQRVHTAGNIVAQCAAHAGELSPADHLATLLDENPRKNMTIASILAQVSAVTHDDISWSFDSNRVLKIACNKLTTVHKTALQSLLNTKFGSGKVQFA